jgi:Flp pilus assembly protein TadB
MFISLIFSITGLIFATRTSNYLNKKGILTSKNTHLVDFFCVFCGMTSIFLNLKPENQFVLCLALPFLPILFAKISFHIRFKKFIEKIPEFLDLLILQVGLGQSIRQSLESLKTQAKSEQIFFIEHCLLSMKVGKTTEALKADKTVEDLANELIEISNNEFKTTERLKSLRSFFKTNRRVRLKSRAALSQAKAQSYVVTTIYILLSIWLFARSEMTITLFSMSFSLLLMGHGGLHYLSRSLKWKD